MPRTVADESVETFLSSLEHPFKKEIIALREIILAADNSIEEGIKWNAPSFRSKEYFATFQLRARDGVQIILHYGAKKRAGDVAIDDPDEMLTWLGPDRASVMFRNADEVSSRRHAFTDILRQWIMHI